MTTFAGINLRPDDGAPGCGAAFVLRNSPYASRTIRYDEWVIDVVKGAKTVIARGRSPRTIERAVEDGLAAANVGLDLMCFQESERLLIDRYDDEHVSWCPAPAGDGLSVVATAAHVLELGLGATGTVRDPHGELVPTSSPSSLSWHPSYRYFRVSQTTTDLHDAYRNAFLALESLLDHVQPQEGGGEGAWFAKAMSHADGLIGHAYKLFPNDRDPVRSTVDEFYRQWRTAVAHSKASRVFILPHDAEARVDLLRSLHRLSEYYVTLAKHVLPVGRGSTHFTQYLFRQMAQSLSQFEVYASDDASAIDLEDDRLSPAGGALVAMTPTGDLDISEPFVAQRAWANHSADLPLPCIRRVVGGQNGDAGFALVLEADLVLASGDWFEARFSWSTVSRTDLRSRYAT